MKSNSAGALQNQVHAEPERSTDGNNNSLAASKSVSFLPPTTLRWLNKRRPPDENAAKVMSASRAIQLRNVFNSLDFDGGGEIELDELKQAINFVAKPRVDSVTNVVAPPLIEDPDKINKFFESMDVDGNGAVDFNEFLFGMTNSKGEDDDTKMQKMQQAFFEFANLHNRQTILDTVADETVSDITKYEKMKQLFGIKFLVAEENIKTVEEQIKHAQTIAKRDMKEMNSANRKQKSIELMRARKASLYFQNELADRRRDNMSIEVAIEKSKFTYPTTNLTRMATSVNCNDYGGNEMDSFRKAESYKMRKRIETKLQQNLSRFPLDSRIENTHQLRLEKTESQLKFGALLESQRIKGGLSASSLSLPPVSIRQQIHYSTIKSLS